MRTVISDAGVVEVKPFLKRLICLHYWHDTHIPDPLVFMNGKFRYLCLRCGKEKSFKYQPINFEGHRE